MSYTLVGIADFQPTRFHEGQYGVNETQTVVSAGAEEFGEG